MISCEGHNLKIIGLTNDLQLRTRLNNNKQFSFDTKALVCSDLNDQTNIGITVMKKFEMSVQYSALGPAIFSFAAGAKQAEAKI